ncbi:HAD family hydrolase [Propionispira raffinosivorans]|uniref:haloacid dehalogenase-like hydrolase n=1 Tax=Propionispira raffinosivorans TaxID=86959 RepID=UPI0003771968|nr:haloacid dehalogenase-like hydrolase [Propionispira raffinosivorans]
MFKFQKNLLITTVMLIMVMFTSSMASAAGQVLTQGKWAPATRTAMQKFIDTYGTKSSNYNAGKKPYVVFDWDNTSIMNDTEEALFMYQIQNLVFKLKPEEFGKIVTKNVPQGSFNKEYNNMAGQAVTLEAVNNDLIRDYTFIYNNYAGMQGKMSLEDIQKTDQFMDFRAKMWYIYQAIDDKYTSKISYTWVLYFFENMTTDEVTALTEKSNDYNLGQAIRKETWLSPDTLPGEAGVVGVSHTTGLRLTEEIGDLMSTLRSNGFDVYVCTASLEDVVAVFATNPKYGYNVARENVIGMQLEKTNNVYQDSYKKGLVPTGEHGKTLGIQRVVADKRGYGPIMVAGDSSGDYNMMTEFPDIKRVLLVNRLKSGSFGKLCAEAAATMGNPNAKFVLQGRNENLGLWNPSEEVIKLGKNTGALLAK